MQPQERAEQKLETMGYKPHGNGDWKEVTEGILISYWKKGQNAPVPVSLRLVDSTIAVWAIVEWRKV